MWVDGWIWLPLSKFTILFYENCITHGQENSSASPLLPLCLIEVWGGVGLLPGALGSHHASCSVGCHSDFGARYWCQGSENHCNLFLHQLTCSHRGPDISGGRMALLPVVSLHLRGWRLQKPQFLCLIVYDPCHFPQLWFLAPADASWSSWEHIPPSVQTSRRRAWTAPGLTQAGRRDVHHSGKCSVPPGRMLAAMYLPQPLPKNYSSNCERKGKSSRGCCAPAAGNVQLCLDFMGLILILFTYLVSLEYDSLLLEVF